MEDWLKTAYGAIGAQYPILSLLAACVIGATVFGGAWWLIGQSTKRDAPASHNKEAPPVSVAAVEPKFPTEFKPIFLINKKYYNERVELDGRCYSNCEFTNVTFVYNGTDAYQFVNNRIIGKIRFDTNHPGLVAMMGLLKGLGALAQNFETDFGPNAHIETARIEPPPSSIADNNSANPANVPRDLVERTKVTHSELKRQFPLGYIIFFVTERAVTCVPYPDPRLEWNADWQTTRFEVNYANREVKCTLPSDLFVERLENGERKKMIHIIGSVVELTFPFVVNRITPAKQIGVSKVSELGFATLNDSQGTPIFVLGFRIIKP